MQKKIFIGGLAWGVDSKRLKTVFDDFGNVCEAKVIMDRQTGRSRGFGFVTFDRMEDATRALSINGQEIDGRTVRVDVAKERAPRDQPRR